MIGGSVGKERSRICLEFMEIQPINKEKLNNDVVLSLWTALPLNCSKKNTIDFIKLKRIILVGLCKQQQKGVSYI